MELPSQVFRNERATPMSLSKQENDLLIWLKSYDVFRSNIHQMLDSLQWAVAEDQIRRHLQVTDRRIAEWEITLKKSVDMTVVKAEANRRRVDLLKLLNSYVS